MSMFERLALMRLMEQRKLAKQIRDTKAIKDIDKAIDTIIKARHLRNKDNPYHSFHNE